MEVHVRTQVLPKWFFSSTTADLKPEYDPFHCGKKEWKINNPLVFLSSEESIRYMTGAGLL